MPHSTIKTPEGLLLIANGIDPVLRWDGLSEPSPAGVAPPTTGIGSLTASGAGNIVGTYYAFLRYVDKDGNPSNLSPITGPLLASRLTTS